MFLGVNTLNLDAKGRMAVPARYRDALKDHGARVVVTINPRERCLWLYPESEWTEIAGKLSRLPTLKPQNLRMQRLLLGHALELEMDGQGRILISNELREYAGLEKRVSLVGQGHKFEIWGADAWLDSRDAWLAEAQDQASELSEELEGMSL